MGTVVTVDIYGETPLDEREFATSFDAVAKVLHDADEVFSTWKPQSPLSRLRRGELVMSDAPAVILDVFEDCRVARGLSRGWFDPWSMPGGVDPTGLVKGWAAQRALDPLRNQGLSGALVNAAGDIASFGGPGHGAPFRFGIVSPADTHRLACVVESPGAVATSGTYERGEHLVSPFAGVAISTPSATVIGPELWLADALATALAVAGPTGLEFVEAIKGYHGLVIETSEKFYASDDFPMVECFLQRP